MEARSDLERVVVASDAEYSATVKVHFHIIMTSNTTSGGTVPDSQVADQISVLNDAYAPTGVKFELVNTTRTMYTAWFRHRFLDEMKQTLRSADASELNVFTIGPDPQGYVYPIAFSTMPHQLSRPGGLALDGVIIGQMQLPGGTDTLNNKGKHLVHEVGHWLGLYDVEHGGCIPESDYVDDTPASQGGRFDYCPADDAPLLRDSCPDLPGVDPTGNFMYASWETDQCISEFTPGQGVRIRKQLARWRDIDGKN